MASSELVTQKDDPLPDVRLEVAALKERVQRILQLAAKAGADSAEVGASASSGLEVRVRQSDLELVQFEQDQALQVTLYRGHSQGSASTTELSPAALEETVAAAWHIASHAMPDEAAGLADAKDMIETVPDLDLYHPWMLQTETAQAIAIQAEEAAWATSPLISNSNGASVGTTRSVAVYGNSHGFMGEVAGSRHQISCAMIASEHGEMQQDYWYSIAREMQQLEDAQAIGRLAGERTVARLGGSSVPTGARPVLLAASEASGFMGHLIGAMSGGALYRKASFLLDRLGEQILPERYSLYERPLIPGGLFSAPFDQDGLATREQSFVEAGQLVQYVLSTYSARRLGMTSTANAGGVHNLHINHDGQSLGELLAEMGDGFYVTELMGPGVNLVTGDYSRGASGFLVEGGHITRPVQGVTIAGQLPKLFMNIRAIGRDTETRTHIRVGPMLIDGFTIAGD